MKLALVTTPSDVDGGVRGLLPHLRSHFDVDVFVEAGSEGERLEGVELRSIGRLSPRAFDRILYEVGNDSAYGFMLPIVRALGGTVALRDWNLSAATRRAFPSLASGGFGGLWVAAREGGATGARVYLQRRDGEPSAETPPWNRSIVRHADSFIVPRREWLEKILADRNAPTPIAVVPAGSERSMEDVASSYAEALRGFPRHRSARRSVLREMIDAVRNARPPAVRT